MKIKIKIIKIIQDEVDGRLACSVGEKMRVDEAGKLHLCFKINAQQPISK